MDLLPDRALLEARRDLLLVLLRDRNLLVAVFPRLLALSLAFRSPPSEAPSPLRRLEITSSREAALAILDRCQEPFYLLVSEHLADGPGLDLVAAVRQRSPQHRCVLLLTHNHRVLVEAALASGADAVVLEESLGRTGALVHAVEQLVQGRRFIDPACGASGEASNPEGPPRRKRSRHGRWRCCGWWPRAAATGRSASSCTSPPAPPATTCRTSCGAWGCAAGRRRRWPAYGSATAAEGPLKGCGAGRRETPCR